MCIASLKRQNYPNDIEILLINDQSEDNSVMIAKQAASECPLKIKILHSNYIATRNLTSKQQAIDFGIRAASNECIVLTDADMQFTPDWLASLYDALPPDTDLAYGHSAIRGKQSFFPLFQSFQLEFLFAVAAIFHYCGIVGSCMGNNLIVRKKAYLECGGYNSIGYTMTEDRALLRFFLQHKRKVRITSPFIPTAYTFPHESLYQFVLQAKRWIFGGISNGKNLLITGILFSFYNIISVLVLSGIVTGINRIFALCDFFLLWICIAISFHKNRSPVSAILFPFYYLLLLSEIVILPILLLTGKKITWKDRSL